MRTHLLFATLVTLGLVGGFAGAALAQGGGDGSETTAREARVAALREARNESLRMFHENRTAAIDDYKAAHNATRASFLENKTRVLSECEALRNSTEDENATKQCVRDGLKPLIEKARAEHKAQKDALLDALLEARTNAKAHFQAARESMRARPSG